ncbi:MAG: neutral/alkaline non-lysosomal ceramidase N-terminal domain-containing protein [Bryobacteraceae bacterium]
MMRANLLLVTICLLPGNPAQGAPAMKAGAAKIDITPDGPIWMSGYAARNKPSEGVLTRLWAKALALEDARGNRAVIVTTDLIGLPMELTDVVAARAMERYKLERAGLVFNSSHTHTGPVVRGNLSVMESQQSPHREALAAYRQRLEQNLLDVIGAALADLAPAELAFDYGEARFGVNRRQFTPKGVVIGVNPDGPTDPRVPVLRVTKPAGKVRAILFGYACHNTTLTAEFYQLSGDYAGYAQEQLEREFPGAVALFLQLCGGDQNPNPRSKLEYAEQHGRTLAAEVARVARTKMQPAGGRLRMSYQLAALPFAPHTRAQFEEELKDENVFRQRRAELMLKLYDERREPRQLRYPVQAVRLENGFTMIALGGEVVVDYALWAYRTWPRERLIVAGYSNDVPCYIPSARVLREGGYEAVDSMIYYGQPGPFTEEVEARIHDAVRQAMKRVGR